MDVPGNLGEAQMNLQRPARAPFVAYVLLVLVSGAGFLLWSWIRPGSVVPVLPLATFGFWLFLSLAAECFWLETPTGSGMVSMSLAVNMATLFVLPLHMVLTIGALSVGLSDLLLHRRDLIRASFNAAQTAISLFASQVAIHLVSGHDAAGGTAILLRHPLAALSAPVVFFFVNTFMVAGVIALHGRIRFWSAWRENYGFGYQYLSSATLFLLGVTLVVASESIGYISGLLYLLFFFFIRDAYRRFVRDRARKLART